MQPSYHDKVIADLILAQKAFHPDMVKRNWYNALLHNLEKSEIRFPQSRVYRPSDTPFEACWELIQETDGHYYEGLIFREGDAHPEPAVWCDNPFGVTCFTHDLSRPHGLQGICMDPDAIQSLYFVHGIRGPYLFHPNEKVLQIFTPTYLPQKWKDAKRWLQ